MMGENIMLMCRVCLLVGAGTLLGCDRIGQEIEQME
jgi:hypothetical protein